MKTKISHLGRSTVSVILAVMMLLSTMLIGTVSTVNAVDLTKFSKVYLDANVAQYNSSDTMKNIPPTNAYVFNGGERETYTDENTSEPGKAWPGGSLKSEGNNIYSILVSNDATKIIFNSGKDGKKTGDLQLPSDWQTTPMIYRGSGTDGSAGWEEYSASVDTTGVVTDKRLISVLDGSNVMFYGGEAWDKKYFAAMKTSDETNVADVAQMKYNKELQSTTDGNTTNKTYKFGILCVSAGTYYMGHSSNNTTIDWNSGMSVSVSAGDAFILWNNNNNAITGYTKIKSDSNSNNAIFKSDVSGTTTADTTLSDNEVATGDLLGVTTSAPAGSSSLGFANTFEYYVHNITTDEFYKVALSDGMLDTSAFTDVGNYEVKTVLKDANGLYVLADSDNFVISNKAKYSVTFGSNDANMGEVTVSDGTNSYTTSPASVEEGKSVTFTANPKKGYAVEGWYSDANCQNAITNAGTKTSYEVTVHGNINVYVKFESTTIDPEYRLTGDLSAIGGWKGYSQALQFDTAESDGSYSKIITVTNEDVNSVNRKYFKLIDKNDKYYGPNSAYDIILCNSSDKAYNTFDTSGENSDFYFSKAGTYKIHYIVKTDKNAPSVWVEKTTTKYYTVTVETDKASVNKTEAKAGETVTVTATPGAGQVLESVTVVSTADNKPVTTELSGNTATFKMPDQDVTVTKVTFRPVKTYTVKFSSSDETYGTVSATNGTTSLDSPATVTEGDTVTFTATPISSGYTFKDWTVTVNNTPQTYTGSSLPLEITADTTVVANFEKVTVTPSGYYLLCGTDATFKADSYTSVPLYTNEEGVYYADFDLTQNSIPTGIDYFIIFSETNDTSRIIDTNNAENIIINKKNNGKGFSLNDHNENVNVVEQGTKNVRFAKVYIDKDNKDEVSGFTINITNLDLRSKTITYSAKPKFKEAPRNAVNIIAKNGTQTAKFQSMGTTVITPVENVVFGIGKYNDYTKKATAIKGSKVTVTTTVADAYKDTYYVKGFVVNGESYGIQSGPNDDGVYTLEYQIPDDVDDGTNFEITPVYFLKDSSNCVTFYVEGFDGAVQESWGNTIACYPYYEGLSNATDKNAFGAYPGQPLLYEGGKYYTQIPKSITLDDADKKIVGMTLNNFTLESVHGAISTIKENKQSYDYDDFVRIANNNYGNNIIYTFKYSTAKDNFGTDTVSPDTITKEDFDSDSGTGNGWEDLTDYNHRKVDLFGNVLTGTDSEKEPLLVVSNGYFENYQGFYATEWTVYELKDGSYSKIAQIPSSALLLKSKDDLTNSTSDKKYENSLKSYADAYAKLEAYKNTPAQITFESSIKRGYSLQGGTNGGQGGESAERVDGRWYYSKLGEEITAKIAVEYGDTATSSFTNDLFVGDTNETTTIGAHAYFTNDVVYGKTTYKSNIDSAKYFTFTADTIATDKDGQNYVFLGWYLLSDEKYTKLTDAKAPMTGSDTFVARYVKAPAGTVTIDHKLFSAASNPTPTPTPGTGSGKCYVTVKVLDKTTGEVIKEFAETEKSVTLDKTYIDSSKNYKLQITLRTVTYGQDQFQKFYYLAQNKQDYVGIDAGTPTTGNETTVTREVDILKSFFNRNDDGTYTFKNTTGSDSIHYYSDITETKIPYKITFNYEPRLESDAKQYVVKGFLTSEYISKHGAKLTDEFVMSVAPYEDNFFNTIKWNNANITINNDTETKTAVVNSTTSLRTVTVKALDVNGDQIKAYELNGKPEFASTVVYGSLLTYKNLYGLTDTQKTEIAGGKEYIYVAKPEYDGKKFSYWQISTSSEMTDTSAYVTKCFSQEFNYIAYNDYYIWPVYGESQSITGASTTLNFLDYSRNQSTDPDGNKKTDRVFADFALAFDSNGIQLKTYEGNNIKVGMFLEVCGDLESDSNDNVITNIDYYKDKPGYRTSDADLEEIKRVILEGSTTKNLTYTTVDGITRKLLNKPIDIKSLDNKNRIEYYVGYNNTGNNQKKLMRAYSYVIVDGKITLCSTCYSFVNYYNVGNKTYTVS